MLSVSRLRSLAIIPLVLGLAACGGDGTDTAATSTEELMAVGPLPDMTLGDPSAPVTIIEYASLTCSHCRAFHETVFDRFVADYVDTGQVFFIFREFPLDPIALAGAAVARCAAATGGYFGMVDLLFENQPAIVTSSDPGAALAGIAIQAGFTQESFEACLSNQDMIDGINWSYDHGVELGVNATPTFFINGTKHAGEISLDEIGRLVADAR